MTRLQADNLSVCSRNRGEQAHIENGSQATSDSMKEQASP